MSIELSRKLKRGKPSNAGVGEQRMHPVEGFLLRKRDKGISILLAISLALSIIIGIKRALGLKPVYSSSSLQHNPRKVVMVRKNVNSILETSTSSRNHFS